MLLMSKGPGVFFFEVLVCIAGWLVLASGWGSHKQYRHRLKPKPATHAAGRSQPYRGAVLQNCALMYEHRISFTRFPGAGERHPRCTGFP